MKFLDLSFYLPPLLKTTCMIAPNKTLQNRNIGGHTGML